MSYTKLWPVQRTSADRHLLSMIRTFQKALEQTMEKNKSVGELFEAGSPEGVDSPPD